MQIELLDPNAGRPAANSPTRSSSSSRSSMTAVDFDSKQAVLDVLLSSTYEQVLEEALAIVARGESPEVTVRALVESRVALTFGPLRYRVATAHAEKRPRVGALSGPPGDAASVVLGRMDAGDGAAAPAHPDAVPAIEGRGSVLMIGHSGSGSRWSRRGRRAPPPRGHGRGDAGDADRRRGATLRLTGRPASPARTNVCATSASERERLAGSRASSGHNRDQRARESRASFTPVNIAAAHWVVGRAGE